MRIAPYLPLSLPPLSLLLNASHAARCVSCQGIGSHPVPMALVCLILRSNLRTVCVDYVESPPHDSVRLRGDYLSGVDRTRPHGRFTCANGIWDGEPRLEDRFIERVAKLQNARERTDVPSGRILVTTLDHQSIATRFVSLRGDTEVNGGPQFTSQCLLFA